MPVTVTETSTPDGRRQYSARNRAGETVTAIVHPSGFGFKVFWAKVLARWPKAYLK